MGIKEQKDLALELRDWLRGKPDDTSLVDIVGGVALLLGDLLGTLAAHGDVYDAEVLRVVIEQRFRTQEALVADEDEGFEVEEEEEDEGDRIEGEEEGSEEGFGV
jgi:hypothetical protein